MPHGALYLPYPSIVSSYPHGLICCCCCRHRPYCSVLRLIPNKVVVLAKTNTMIIDPRCEISVLNLYPRHHGRLWSKLVTPQCTLFVCRQGHSWLVWVSLIHDITHHITSHWEIVPQSTCTNIIICPRLSIQATLRDT